MKSMIHNEVIIRAGILICMLIDAFGYDPKNPKKLNYTLARKDMANMAVTTYETIIRNLAKLEEMKVIKLTNVSGSVILPLSPIHYFPQSLTRFLRPQSNSQK